MYRVRVSNVRSQNAKLILTRTTAVVLLFAIAVQCNPINWDKLRVNLLASSEENNDQPAFRPAEIADTDDNHYENQQVPRVDKINICRTEGDDVNNTELLFKNPKYIFGKEFNGFKAKSICSSYAIVRGGKTNSIRFSKRGGQMCQTACDKLSSSILRVKPTVVTLYDNYCTMQGLKPATCVCVYKVVCHERIHYAFVTIIPNINGGVAMLFSEAGQPLNTTSLVHPSPSTCP